MPEQDTSNQQQTPTTATQPANNQSAAQQNLPPMPDQWPGGFGAYKYSKQAVMFNLGTIAFIILILFAVNGAMYPLKSAGSLLSLIFGAFANAAVAIVILGSLNKQKVELGDAFSKSVPFWLNMVILEILVGITYVLSFIALIVPFFFVAPRLALANYYLVDKKLNAIDAYKASWDATKGNVGKVYGIVGASIAMGLLALTVIGIPFAIYFLFMYSAVLGVLYKYIEKNPAASAQQPAPAAPAADSAA